MQDKIKQLTKELRTKELAIILQEVERKIKKDNLKKSS